MILIGLGTPALLGLTGSLIGTHATHHKSLLVGLNLLAISLAIATGYII